MHRVVALEEPNANVPRFCCQMQMLCFYFSEWRESVPPLCSWGWNDIGILLNASPERQMKQTWLDAFVYTLWVFHFHLFLHSSQNWRAIEHRRRTCLMDAGSLSVLLRLTFIKLICDHLGGAARLLVKTNQLVCSPLTHVGCTNTHIFFCKFWGPWSNVSIPNHFI